MTSLTAKLVRRSHSTRIDAPAGVVYQLVADAARWPVVFGPTVHVEHIARSATDERFRIWATVNGGVSTWTSRRHLDPVGLRVTFEQERSQAPVASMGGEWSFRAIDADSCEITLDHHFTAVDDDPASIDWINTALDRNGEAELAALRRIAELGQPLDDVLFEFEDVVRTDGSAADVYEYIRRGDLWPLRLPHVHEATMTEDADGVQALTMVTRTADGTTHSTSSTRLCLPDNRIVYKQHEMPALLLGHSGQWTCTDDGGGATITARHLVAVNPAAIGAVLGPDSTLADARVFLRNALGDNSRTTLSFACRYAEERP
jgi:ribosome-associated toxin RatA of RatAB toxin-antitoxin module